MKTSVAALPWSSPPSVDVVLRRDHVELEVRVGDRRFTRTYAV